MKKHRENIFQYEAFFEPNGAGYTVTVSKLPGLVTEGSNLKEARKMGKDAIKCYLEAILKDVRSYDFGIAKRREITLAV